MSELEFQVRRATLADASEIADFNCALAEETEGKSLDRSVVGRGVSRGMRQGAEVVYFVAERAASHDLADAPQLIGCLMLTREWSDWRDGWLAWIQSVYVRPEYRGQGVFRAILEYALSELRSTPDVIGVRLYVENENTRAQEVYLRTGFRDPNYRVLEQIFTTRSSSAEPSKTNFGD